MDQLTLLGYLQLIVLCLTANGSFEGGESYSVVREAVVGRESLDDALNSLPANGGLLKLIYSRSDAPTAMRTLHLLNKNVTIQGQGSQGPMLTCYYGQPVIKVMGGDVEVRDLNIHGCEIVAVDLVSPKSQELEWSFQIHRSKFSSNNIALKVDDAEANGLGNVNITACEFIHSTASAVEVHGIQSMVVSQSKFRNNRGLFGGGLLLEQRIHNQHAWSLTITESSFEGNRANIYGGGIHTDCDSNGKILIQGTNFTDNTAQLGGAVHVQAGVLLDASEDTSHIPNVTVHLLSSTFMNNTARDGGGGVMMENIASIAMALTKFEHCSSAMGGGVLGIFRKEWSIRVTNSLFQSNKATDRGGGIFIHSSADGAISVRDNKLARNSAGTVGGGIFANVQLYQQYENIDIQYFPNVTLDVRRSSFLDNAAKSGGGAVYLHNVTTCIVDMSTFRNCSVELKGGALVWVSYFRYGRLSIRGSNFVQNAAIEQGGAVYFEGNGQLKIASCAFEENESFGVGGAVSAFEVWMNPLDIEFLLSRFVKNKALVGGALYGSNIHGMGIREVVFHRNSAAVGGAIAFNLGSTYRFQLNMQMSILSDNTAQKKISPGLYSDFLPFSEAGGALAIVALYRSSSRRISVWSVKLTSSVFKANRARNGGALLAVSPEYNNGNWLQLSNCTFEDNSALESGGAIVVDNPDEVDVICGGDVGTAKTTLQELSPPYCGDWKRNGVGYGSPTHGREVGVVAALSLGPIRFNQSHIESAQSRPHFPVIAVTLQDALNGSRALGGIGKVEVTANCNSRMVALFGDTTQVAVNGTAEFSLRVWGFPGIYTIVFNATNTIGLIKMKSVQGHATFELRGCEIGERSFWEDGRYLKCEHCNPGFFSFHPASRACEECHEHAKCDASEDNRLHPLVPQDGYWHSSPFSTQIHKCINRASCVYDGRKQKLQAFHAAHLPRNPRAYSQTEYPMCSKGASGPLCGSCQDHYAHVKNGKCMACGRVLLPIMGIILGGVWTMIMMMITVYFNFSRLQDIPEQSQSEEIELLIRLHQETGDISGTEASQFSEDSPNTFVNEELNSGKRIVQLFKIAVNFFQVNSTALLLNFGWMIFLRRWLELQDVAVLASASAHGNWLAPECAFQSYENRAIIAAFLDIGLPFVLCVSIAVFWAFLFLVRRRSGGLKTETQIIFWSAAFYSYNSLTKAFMRMFACIRVDKDLPDDPLNGQSVAKGLYWVPDTRFQCFVGAERLQSLITGTLGASLFLIGLPVYLSTFLYWKRGILTDHMFQRKYGFLYQTYRYEYAFWEAVIMVRKFLVATIAVFSETLGAELQGHLMLGVVMAATMAQLHARPFKDQKLNCMEVWSLLTTGFTFYLGGIMNGTSDVGKALLSGIAFILNLIFCFALARMRELHAVAWRRIRMEYRDWF